MKNQLKSDIFSFIYCIISTTIDILCLHMTNNYPNQVINSISKIDELQLYHIQYYYYFVALKQIHTDDEYFIQIKKWKVNFAFNRCHLCIESQLSLIIINFYLIIERSQRAAGIRKNSPISEHNFFYSIFILCYFKQYRKANIFIGNPMQKFILQHAIQTAKHPWEMNKNKLLQFVVVLHCFKMIFFFFVFFFFASKMLRTKQQTNKKCAIWYKKKKMGRYNVAPIIPCNWFSSNI